jgi:hypothetical protein
MEGAAHSGVRSYQRPLPIYPLIEGITELLILTSWMSSPNETEGAAPTGLCPYQRPLPIHGLVRVIIL